MRIVATWRTDYAIRALIFLAQDQRELSKAVEVADAMKMPKGFLHQVLQTLQRAGLVVSRPSRYGGYALARPAEKISLLEVVEAMEGPVDAAICVIQPELSRRERGCALHSLWTSAAEAVSELLRRTTVAEMANATVPLPADPKAVCPVTEYLHDKGDEKKTRASSFATASPRRSHGRESRPNRRQH